uniref:DDE-type integrase/transposase/recombinase n=1 Tax=Streptomyces halobius TaxID=2879846 RepID=UPI003872C9D0
MKINGERHSLWRAIDQNGNVLDILVQSKWDTKAARRFMAKLMKKQMRVPGAAQKFLSAFSGISPHFRPRRHLMTAADHRFERLVRFTVWDHITAGTGLPATG